MKKALILMAAGLLSTAALHAQTTDGTTTTTTDTKVKASSGGTHVKVKPKTTVKDKAYNAVHRHKKRSHGTKVKAKQEPTTTTGM